MTEEQWNIFCRFKKDFKELCRSAEHWNKDGFLRDLGKRIALENGIADYDLETNVVYNRDLELFTKESTVKYILVADNPGKNEQLAKNNRYLIGQAGKLAEKFFKDNPELNTDFRNNVLIINKSPLHTARTALLKKLLQAYKKEKDSDELQNFFEKSQVFMAESSFKLEQTFACDLWIVGYAELGKKKIFEKYWLELKSLYTTENAQRFFCFQHFSMNRFSIDLKQNYDTKLSLKENVDKLGKKHSQRIFGF